MSVGRLITTKTKYNANLKNIATRKQQFTIIHFVQNLPYLSRTKNSNEECFHLGKKNSHSIINEQKFCRPQSGE